ncbi:DUF1846 domain-containing protein [Sneathia sanguinegens]|uniref:DUF1846 domain-containing protein n=1 Tax=Sneathia sanguinegens TaxID=40543 RepID=UPI00082FBDD4|nr:DUF1846 domain-containing protein [Sneathia sanguinegens]
MKIGFDHEKYLTEQSKYILERVNEYDKLYIEFGGKLFSDLHAKRVLPGFKKDAKVELLHKLKDKLEVIICVYSGDIERNKLRGDLGITYDLEVLRIIDDLHANDLQVNSVVITRYTGQPSAKIFKQKLESRGIKVYIFEPTMGYPNDIDVIVSEEGFGQRPYIKTTKPIVVVTAPGPGSGKLATCLAQLYNEHKHGVNVGYAKFETFPVWNLPLKHPLNIAYEAATVDLKDVNMIDTFHLNAYGINAVNYNRDIEAFPILKRIIEKIKGYAIYKSPTDMGVNRLATGIIDDEVVKKASCDEIIRRMFKTACEYKKGYVDLDVSNRAKMIMEELNLKETDRPCVIPAREKAEKSGFPSMAIELDNGKIITGRTTEIMEAAASAILNAIKYLANIDENLHLIAPAVLTPILKLKKENLAYVNAILTVEEVLIALSISATTNPSAALALQMLPKLKHAQAHSTTILPTKLEQLFTKLEIDVTADPVFATDKLYY